MNMLSCARSGKKHTNLRLNTFSAIHTIEIIDGISTHTHSHDYTHANKHTNTQYVSLEWRWKRKNYTHILPFARIDFLKGGKYVTRRRATELCWKHFWDLHLSTLPLYSTEKWCIFSICHQQFLLLVSSFTWIMNFVWAPGIQKNIRAPAHELSNPIWKQSKSQNIRRKIKTCPWLFDIVKKKLAYLRLYWFVHTEWYETFDGNSGLIKIPIQ